MAPGGLSEGQTASQSSSPFFYSSFSEDPPSLVVLHSSLRARWGYSLPVARPGQHRAGEGGQPAPLV